jgi:hypothetical protein
MARFGTLELAADHADFDALIPFKSISISYYRARRRLRGLPRLPTA